MVVSGLPQGSACSMANGYSMSRPSGASFNITVTHHATTARGVACTEDYPYVETNIPLGSDFSSGETYRVSVNGETLEFEAQ